jgi:TolB-like protein
MKLYSLVFVTIILSGCSQTPDEIEIADSTTESVNRLTTNDTLHKQVTLLANNLFSTSKDFAIRYPVAVGTFLPIQQIDGQNLPQDKEVGHLIQESFVTLGTQAGLNIVEYKTMPAIKLSDGYDIMLSRDIKNLNTNFSAKYYLTGTYTEQNEQLIVNARIIDLQSMEVKAAATRYIPINVTSNHNKLSLKNNMIYRNIN